MFAKGPSHSTALGPGCAGPPLANPQNFGQAGPGAHEHGSHQPSCGAAPFAVDASMLRSAGSQPHKHTQYELLASLAVFFAFSWHLDALSVIVISRSPYVTGSSVLGITYAGGVMLASDTLGEKCSILFQPGRSAKLQERHLC